MNNQIAQRQHEVSTILNKAKKRLSDVNTLLQTKVLQEQSLQSDIDTLNERYKKLKESIGRKRIAFQEYSKLHEDSEGALEKLRESAKVLLGAVKKESAGIQRGSKPNGEF